MAEAKIVIKRFVTLALNEQEAKWLKAVMQNPLREDEDESDSKFREELFETLKDAGV